MRYLLAAVNAKYIHSNLGIYSLKRYAQERLLEETCFSPSIEIGEYTINNQTDSILQDIYRRDPDVAGFSCYIWNILYVRELVRDLKKIKPDMHIWLGGPEVSYDAEEVLRAMPEVDCVMSGEGEDSFYRLIKAMEAAGRGTADGCGYLGDLDTAFSLIPGITYREGDGTIRKNTSAPLMNLWEIPFAYEDLSGMDHRIIYYESSRGCPFSCSYCLSSIDKTVRFRDTDLVKKELGFFLEQRVPQVKFVDRTFNCKKSHAMEIWRFIHENDNGVTNFHFEISADLLDEEEICLMSQMRPGLIQLEIGVQTTNQDTIREIRRSMDLNRLKGAVERINSFGNIHQHLDLIAGLPYEDYESFKKSFNQVYAMEPEQLQLGFLKVLKGSYMEEMRQVYGLLHKSQPPYEVLSTKWLSYGDVMRLKGVEMMVEIHHNSGQYRFVLRELVKLFESPFAMYEALARYYETRGLMEISHNRLARYEILYRFICELSESDMNVPLPDVEKFRDLLMYDLYLRENLKSRPSFARDQSPYKEEIRKFFMEEAKTPRLLTGYEGYEYRQISKMAHVEAMGDGELILFDYLNRDALLGNARAAVISERNGYAKRNESTAH